MAEHDRSPESREDADKSAEHEERKARLEEKRKGGWPAPGPEVGTRFSATEIHDHIVEEARDEMERPASDLSWSALASGMLIGFSFLAVAFLHPYFPGEQRKLAAALGYPLGFLFVVIGRHQLFTENTLEPVLPALERRDGGTFRKLMRIWGIVLPMNLLGALILGLLLARTELVDAAMRESLSAVAREAVSGGFVVVLYKAIWAGWLVALMAWIIASTHDTMAQIALVALTTAPIAALGFKHSIAGAVEAFHLGASGQAPWGTLLLQFELPAIIGNIIGGVVLVALVNHGQTGGARR